MRPILLPHPLFPFKSLARSESTPGRLLRVPFVVGLAKYHNPLGFGAPKSCRCKGPLDRSKPQSLLVQGPPDRASWGRQCHQPECNPLLPGRRGQWQNPSPRPLPPCPLPPAQLAPLPPFSPGPSGSPQGSPLQLPPGPFSPSGSPLLPFSPGLSRSLPPPQPRMMPSVMINIK